MSFTTEPTGNQKTIPLARARVGQSNRLTLAVMEYTSGFMDDKVGKAILLGKVPYRNKTGCFLA
jgi:hypothetical protein